MKQRTLLIAVTLLLCCALFGTTAPPVQHPNLLLNREEIAQIKVKIQQQEWAANLLTKVKAMANGDNTGDCEVREMALSYVLTGERGYADRARGAMLTRARQEIPQFEAPGSTYGQFNMWQTPWDTYAWAYDLTYDTCSDEERQTIERWLHDAAHTVMAATKLNGTTPNLMFVMHFNVGIVGYALGDQELIDWSLNDPGFFGPQSGGFYPVMDSVVKDKMFWGEAPLYGLQVDLWGMLALAEAALHYDGTDLYHYVSKKSGGSLKGMIDGYLRMGFPLERTGIGAGALRIASFGDGSIAYSVRGTMRDEYLTDEYFLGAVEIGYKRYKDPGYAWLLSQNPKRDTDLGWRWTVSRRAGIWGYIALTHGEVLPAKLTPPPAPSGVYPGQGFAMLHADESPNFWTSNSLAAVLKLGNSISHGHSDYYGLILHGKGRLLFPDLQLFTYETTYLGWSHEGIGHNTLLVDGQSPKSAPYTTLSDFTPDVKFAAITGSPFDDVVQTRRMLLTKDYLADVFHAADQLGTERVFDWVLHGLGRIYPGNPTAYRPTSALLANYWWVENEHGRTTDQTWQMDWIQRSAGIAPGKQFTPEWFNHEVGVRMTMLGVPGTQVYYGDGPITNGPPHGMLDGNPEGSVPMTVARRQDTSATYVAVHEPYEGAPRIRQVRRLAETPEAIALAITTPDFTDYVLTAFDDKPHTLTTPAGEAFTFTDYAYLRMTKDQVTARGKLMAFRLGTQTAGDAKTAALNGKQEFLRRQGAFMQFGDVPGAAPAVEAKEKDDPAEHAPALYYYCFPNEVHLSAQKAGDAREVEVRLRAVGNKVQGTLQVAVREGVRVTPSRIDIAPLNDGEERTVRLTVQTTEKARTGLYPISFIPAEGTNASRQSLITSVGVVMTVDRRIPEKMQYVYRTPGYTIKVDSYSGVSYYLLDADGNRRYGEMYATNFCYGIPSVSNVRWGSPTEFIWAGDNGVTVGGYDVRLRYTFYEDRMVFTVVPPTDGTKTYTMWMGNFDALKPPVFHGTPENGHQFPTNVADWFYFPHPTFKQGVLITPPPKTALSYAGSAVSFPIKVGQDVTLKFATEEEIAQLK